MNNLKDLYKLIICVTWAGRGGRGVSEKEQERDQQAGSAAGGRGGRHREKPQCKIKPFIVQVTSDANTAGSCRETRRQQIGRGSRKSVTVGR